MISMNAQVGVNNSSPEQALDVNGKIKLTDDATTPTKGTMRYNDSEGSFEGHNGTQWNSFSAKPTASLPTNPVPVYGYSSGIGKNERESLSFSSWTSVVNYKTPPSGKLLVVTGIYPRPNGLSKDANFQFSIGVSSTLNGSPIISTSMVIFVETNVTMPIVGDSAPLFVLNPGQYLTVIHESSSSINFINMNIRGFLVDDLNY